jgi:hypothetical protein
MIQRKQSIWLLLAAVLAFLSLKLPVYTGNILDASNAKVFISHTLKAEVKHGLLLITLTAVLGTLCLVTIFLYKSRTKQMYLCLGLTILALLNLYLYYIQSKVFVDGTFAITALIVLAIPFCTLLAARGIYKDEQLVKSLDRIR